MAIINFARKEILCKVVYYGPAFSGKTTNLRTLHNLIPEKQRGALESISTEADRTLFFDFLPIQLGQIAGFTANFKVFTVPGQIVYKETRAEVLKGADAVVFVADSSPDRQEMNVASLVDLEENLRAQGHDLASIPLVIQLNKRDALGALPREDMEADLNPFGVPVIEANATDGTGVLKTLRLVTEIAAQRVRENLSGEKTAVALTAVEKAEAEDDQAIIQETFDRIMQVRPAEESREAALRSAGALRGEHVDNFQSPPTPARPAPARTQPARASHARHAPDTPPPAPSRVGLGAAMGGGFFFGASLGLLAGLALGWLLFHG